LAAKIKLKRMGKKGAPYYRVVIQDESGANRGREIEAIGFYNPLLETSKFEVKKEKALEWIKKGAKPTEKVRILLGKAGILPPVSFEGRVKRAPKVKGETATEGVTAPAPAPSAEAKPAPEQK